MTTIPIITRKHIHEIILENGKSSIVQGKITLPLTMS